MRFSRLAILAAAVLVGTIGQAQASHIFSQNILINGTPVASGGAFTNPLITINAGDSVTFSFGLWDTDPSTTNYTDSFNVSFAATGGTLPAPANSSVGYTGNGTSGSPITYTFSRTFSTAGSFVGNLTPNFPSSFPDYVFPNGNQTSEPQIPFTIQVNGAVPEPSTFAIVGMFLAIGAGCYFYRRQRTGAASVV